MTEPKTASHPRISPTALRIVLFGMPDAGKTSLLGALAQASETQSRILQGKLVDRSEGLSVLRKQVYEESARETLEEIVPYPVTLEPNGKPRIEAVLYDCDGRVANEILSKRKSLEADTRKNSLAHAVLAADALILVVDASAPETQIDNDFREFVQFVRYLNTYRAERHEVGGLPVFLVLSKCDLLVNNKSTTEEWEAIIGLKTKEVEDRFRFFLGDGDEGSKSTGFGSISLTVEHTAVRRPALKDAPASTREPFGVAELFYDVFTAAEQYRSRQQIAQKRLKLTLTLVGGFLLLLLGAGVWWLAFRTNEGSLELFNKLESYRLREGGKGVIGASKETVRERLASIDQLAKDSDFDKLSLDSKSFIQSRKSEFEAYLKFRDELEKFDPLSKLTGYSDLVSAEDNLKTKIVPPETYRQAWARSEAVDLREQLLKDIPIVRTGFKELERYYEELRTRGKQLLAVTELTPKWESQFKSLMDDDQKLPFAETAAVKGAAFKLNDLPPLQNQWQSVRDTLRELRNLATAIGLLGDTTGTQPVLALLDLPANADLNRIAGERLQALRQQYPDHKNWNLSKFSDGIRPQLEFRLRQLNELSIREGQKLIRSKFRTLNSTSETLRNWLDISEWLLTPDVQNYREFNTFLARLYDPQAVDAVNQLVDFLRKGSFNLELRKLRLTLPETLDGSKFAPVDPLAVYYQSQDQGKSLQTLTLTQVGEAVRDKDGRWSYTFLVKDGEPRITFKPGDTIWATIKLKDANRNMQLTWAKSQSWMYQFERFVREPRLHEADKSNTTGTVAERVSLSVTEGLLPQIPTLLPEMR